MQASSGRQRRRIVLSIATALATGVALTGYSALPQARADLPSRAIAGGDPAGGKDVPCGNPAVALDRITQGFVNELAAQNPPPLSTLSTKAARDVLNKLQAGPVEKLPADVTQKTIKGGPTGEVSLTILRPKGATGTLPGLVYIHGGGWVLGNEMTHDRLVRQLANGANAAVVFVNYTPSPEARYPVAIEQAYFASKWVAEHGQEIGIDSTRLAVAGDSVGGDMTAAVTMMAKERGGVKFRQQVLLYPVTEADFNTASYRRFAENCWLTKANMEYFWDQYAPSAADREQPLAAPDKATTEQLRGLPPALLVTDSDVLRDSAVAYAGKLRAAGVPVEHLDYPETVHDFMMLNALRDTPSAKDAVARTSAALRKALHG
ncbi:alpha/beta hydrolase fold domain-containing protein [Streptomyces sp. SID2999]|uniref:alpha/beta hydrolase n=1 Tax=Streptomyces sp. SID2999 TaxID=2690258 RepID=UPI00136CC5F0|nr:alpha/beta hydrolase [Streptomyces sp. SID2999]MYZ08113.1 alpha/beta hydrolase fold domain-containing protein [Streptomyces sp. SID2999]